MSEYLLRMEDISKIYSNGVVANKNVNFRIKKGEIHALLGENGAGKSTLMKILFGMEKPSSGKIYLNDKEIEMNSSKDAISLGIGMVHQHFMLIDSFTVAHNVTLGIEPKKGFFVNEEEAIKFTKELSEKYKLYIDPKAITGNLPVGLKQKIEIIKALARGAQILILDEPTAVLTPQETEQLFTELKNLKNQGHTIIFISHKIREVKEISDRITILRNGHQVGEFFTNEVTEQEISNMIVGWQLDSQIEKKEIKEGELRIKVKDVSYTSKDNTQILKNVSFNVKAGTIFGIAGVQGNGQTELVEILTKTRNIQCGTIEINGNDIQNLNIKNLRALGYSYIPEDRMLKGVVKDASVCENLISDEYDSPKYCKKSILRKGAISKLANSLVNQFSIKCSSIETKAGSLSGGNIQKIVVARECKNIPKVLIAEQPTRGVDIGAADIIHRELVKLRDEGCAILLISADLSELMKLSDRLVVMYEGEIVAYYDDLKQVTEDELGLCMLGAKRHAPEQIGRMLYE